MNSISVVMPARNAASTIRDAVLSVLACPELSELIVVDDQSCDDTAAIVASLGDPRIRVIPGPGCGISASLNTGFAAARSDYVARCDADDLYPQDRFGWQLDWLEREPSFVAISGGFRSITETGEAVADLACSGPGRDITGELLDGRAISHFCTWLVRRDALAATGGARTWFSTAEDIDLMFRLAMVGHVWHEPRIVYLYRLHDASITHMTASRRRIFFDEAATRFALQRRDGGTDDLDRGCPPELPDANDAPSRSAREIENHLVAAVWAEWQAGRRIQAVRRAFLAVRLKPASWPVWRSLVIVLVKSLAGSADR